MTDRLPWVTEVKQKGGVRLNLGFASTRQAAMNKADRPYRPGFAIVRNFVTDEEWERRSGTWIKVAETNLRPMSRERARAG